MTTKVQQQCGLEPRRQLRDACSSSEISWEDGLRHALARTAWQLWRPSEIPACRAILRLAVALGHFETLSRSSHEFALSLVAAESGPHSVQRLFGHPAGDFFDLSKEVHN